MVEKHLISMAHDKDPLKRAHAMDLIGNSLSAKPDSVWLLLEGTRDKDEEVQVHALYGLMDLKAFSWSVCEVVGKLANDEKQTKIVREKANLLLEQAEIVMSEKLEVLKFNDSKNVQIAIMEDLADGGCTRAFRQIQRLVKSDDPDVSEAATKAFEKLKEIERQRGMTSTATKMMTSGLATKELAEAKAQKPVRI